MGRQQRLDLIREIEKRTDSRVLIYITGDRPGMETQISSDVIPLIYKHLEAMGSHEKISLFLYTTGGITISGYGIVNLIREFCNKYDVIVPFKCLSTGTLMVLGADSVIMSKMGQLGPVDPSVIHPLGPSPTAVAGLPAGHVPVNVEDVASFFDLARKEAKTSSEAELSKVLSMLSQGIHPLVLGAVNRSRNEIRFLAKTLLKQHMTDEGRINSITKTLVEERFSHSYLMGRREAKQDLRLDVADTDETLMEDVMKLYWEYNGLLKLDTPYNHATELGGKNEADITLHRCIVESSEMTHVFSTGQKITRLSDSSSQQDVLGLYRTVTLKDEWEQSGSV